MMRVNQTRRIDEVWVKFLVHINFRLYESSIYKSQS